MAAAARDDHGGGRDEDDLRCGEREDEDLSHRRRRMHATCFDRHGGFWPCGCQSRNAALWPCRRRQREGGFKCSDDDPHHVDLSLRHGCQRAQRVWETVFC